MNVQNKKKIIFVNNTGRYLQMKFFIFQIWKFFHISKLKKFCHFVFHMMKKPSSGSDITFAHLYVVKLSLLLTCPRSRLGLRRVPGAPRQRLWWGQTPSKEANIVEANWDRGKSKLPGSPWKLNAKPWKHRKKFVNIPTRFQSSY